MFSGVGPSGGVWAVLIRLPVRLVPLGAYGREGQDRQAG